MKQILDKKTYASSSPMSDGDKVFGARKISIAYLVSHPIQYQAPLLRLLGAQPDIDLTVFFRKDMSVRRFHDSGFGRAIEWDVPLLDGYRHEFLCPRPAEGTLEERVSHPVNMVKQLKSGRFEVLWVHGFTGRYNLVAIIVAWFNSIPVLVRDEATATSRKRSFIKAIGKRGFFWILGKLCTGFLAIGSLNRAYYIENGIDPKRIFMVPYAVDNDYFAHLARQAAARRDEFRSELALEQGRPIILFASKFEARKRAGDLLAAFDILRARGHLQSKPYLLFVGDGAQRAELEAQAQSARSDVRFLGFRNQSELPAFYDLCDVFVLPSVSEPWGLVVNEVMSVGRPIIVSSEVGCGPDLVKNGLNGYVVPSGDVHGLAEALEKILGEPARVISMGHASKEIIAGWSFHQDLEGMKAALHALTGRLEIR